jgi:hypothetical protein
MLNRYKVTMEPGCRTRHGPSRRASCRKLVRRFCSPECQSLLTSVPIWEKAVRAPFLYRLVPPCTAFYRLLPPFIASHQESFFRDRSGAVRIAEGGKMGGKLCSKAKNRANFVAFCRQMSPSVAFCRLPPGGRLFEGVAGGKCGISEKLQTPRTKHPPPPRLPMNLHKTVHYGAARVCCRFGRRVPDRYRRDACATHFRMAANEPPDNAFIDRMNRFKKVGAYGGQARETPKPRLQNLKKPRSAA